MSDKSREYYLKNKERLLVKQKLYYQNNKEKVKKYQKERYQKYGNSEPTEITKEKNRIRANEYYYKNIDSIKEKSQTYRNNNKEYQKNYNKKYAKENVGKLRNNKKKYKLAKKQACPKWLNKDQINEIELIYNNCPNGFNVDHIIPLRGKNVSGLHVPWNLQYLTNKDNRKKSNKF